MELEDFINRLEEKFYVNNTFFKTGGALKESVLNTIKGQILKKNLVLVSKLEYDKLKALSEVK